jgi:hypothetical protein
VTRWDVPFIDCQAPASDPNVVARPHRVWCLGTLACDCDSLEQKLSCLACRLTQGPYFPTTHPQTHCRPSWIGADMSPTAASYSTASAAVDCSPVAQDAPQAICCSGRSERSAGEAGGFGESCWQAAYGLIGLRIAPYFTTCLRVSDCLPCTLEHDMS